MKFHVKKYLSFAPSLIFIPLYVFVFKQYETELAVTYIYILNLSATLSLFDFGEHIRPFTERSSLLPTAKMMIFIFILQSIIIIFFDNFLPELFLINMRDIDCLIMATYSCLLSLTNRGRILLDLSYISDTYISLLRGMSSVIRWIALLFVLSLSNNFDMAYLFVFIVFEIAYLSLIIGYVKIKPDMREYKFQVNGQAVYLQWISSIGISGVDLIIRNFLLITGEIKSFVIFDVINRLMFLINIFGSFMVRVIQQIYGNSSNRTLVSIFIESMLLIFIHLIITLLLPLHFAFAASIFLVSILSIYRLGRLQILQLSTDKILLVGLYLGVIFIL